MFEHTQETTMRKDTKNDECYVLMIEIINKKTWR